MKQASQSKLEQIKIYVVTQMFKFNMAMCKAEREMQSARTN